MRLADDSLCHSVVERERDHSRDLAKTEGLPDGRARILRRRRIAVALTKREAAVIKEIAKK
jgi:hypothetical protein